MRKFYLVIITLVILTGCGNNQKSSFIPIQNIKRPSTPPTRYVENNILYSDHLPNISIQVHEAFKYIGDFFFEILALSDEYPEEIKGQPIAAGNRYIFASADSLQQVHKLFIVQLEGFLEDNDFIYRYNFDQAELIGDQKYRHNTWFYNSWEQAKNNPQGEGAKTRSYLQDKGYHLQDDFMMSRFVGLASQDRKNEIILFYIEMLEESTGYDLQEFENNLSPSQREEITKAFIERSRNSFEILTGK